MSNVLYFQQALSARNARVEQDDAFRADPLGGFGHAGMDGFDALGTKPTMGDYAKVKQAQTALTFVGFPTGTADGLWGPNTARAARAFAMAANVPAPPDSVTGPSAAFLTPAFDAALSNALAAAKGQPQPLKITTPTGGTLGPGVPALPPGTTAELPMLEKAKQWLLAPEQPIYKKPIIYIGVGIAALTVFLAMRNRD